jgi:tRNA G18 (ribose-2'-O)-methylase SpoU
MPLIPVTSSDDRLHPYRDLPRSNLTRQSGRFVVEGKWLVERLAASEYDVESIVVDDHQLDLLPVELSGAVPVYALPSADLEKLIGFNFHRGILACGRRKSLLASSDIIPSCGKATIVACIDIHDPTNLGGILRNCAAFGVDGVLLSRRCADPFSRRVLRVSMGTAFKLRISVMEDFAMELRRIQSDLKCDLIATVLASDAERLERSDRPERMVLLIGNEGHGLPRECLELANRKVTLPMEHGTDSLNAAAATAVFLYHFTRIGDCS